MIRVLGLPPNSCLILLILAVSAAKRQPLNTPNRVIERNFYWQQLCLEGDEHVVHTFYKASTVLQLTAISQQSLIEQQV